MIKIISEDDWEVRKIQYRLFLTKLNNYIVTITREFWLNYVSHQSKKAHEEEIFIFMI